MTQADVKPWERFQKVEQPKPWEQFRDQLEPKDFSQDPRVLESQQTQARDVLATLIRSQTLDEPQKDSGFFKQLGGRGLEALITVPPATGRTERKKLEKRIKDLKQRVTRDEKTKGVRAFDKETIDALRRGGFDPEKVGRQRFLETKEALAKAEQRVAEIDIEAKTPRTLFDIKTTVPFPETALEKVGATVGGLGAFLVRLALFKNIAGTAGAGPTAATIAGFELENQASGGTPGVGLAMGAGLAAIQKLPIKETYKLLLESTAFGSLAAAEGGDEIDIYIGLAIPFGFRGAKVLRQQFSAKLRAAKNVEEASEIMVEAQAAGEKLRKELGEPKPTENEINELLTDIDVEITARNKQRLADIKARAKEKRETTEIEAEKKVEPKPKPQASVEVEKKRPEVKEPTEAEVEESFKKLDIKLEAEEQTALAKKLIKDRADGIRTKTEIKPEAEKVEPTQIEKVKEEKAPTDIVTRRVEPTRDRPTGEVKVEKIKPPKLPVTPAFAPGDTIKVGGRGEGTIQSLLVEKGKGAQKYSIKDNISGQIYRANEGNITLVSKRKPGVALPVPRPTKPKEVAASVLESKEGQKVELFVAPDVEGQKLKVQKLDQINRAEATLSPDERNIIQRRFGRAGEQAASVEDLAKELGRTEDEILKVEDRALTKMRESIETQKQVKERAEAEQEFNSDPRINLPPGSRPGFVSSSFLSAGRYIAGLIPKGLNAAIQRESRDMIDWVGRSGGEFGKKLSFGMRKTVDNIGKWQGRFQVEQTNSQKAINRHLPSAWTIQDVPVNTKHPSWTANSVMFDSVFGRIEPRNSGEGVIVNLIRKAVMTTGRAAQKSGFKVRDKSSGRLRPFVPARDGKTLPFISTRQMHDFLVLGPGNPGYDLMIRAYAEANAHIINKTTGKNYTHSDVANIFNTRIRKAALQPDGRAGYKEIGLEIERFFDVRPTHLFFKTPVRTKLIPLAVTEPRALLDAIYNNTATRLGFTETFGQDGKKISKLRGAYNLAGGATDVFDATIRTMQGLPMDPNPTGLLIRTISPTSPFYRTGEFFDAMIQLAKQPLLSTTPIIQPTELAGFPAVIGYRNLMKGLSKVVGSKEGRDAILAEMLHYRAYTKDITSFSINRGNLGVDFIRKFASTINIATLNKVANEKTNEFPAAIQGTVWVDGMVKRGRRGEPPTERDMNALRALNYSEADVVRLASGKGSKEENGAITRRWTKFAVDLISAGAQRSPLRNKKWYRTMVAFTRFFSNRINQFSLLGREVMEATKSRNPKRMRVAAYQLGKFAVGIEAAGIFATVFSTYMRQGTFGVQQLYHEAQDEKGEFLLESFVSGTFGPVFGTFARTTKAAFEGQPSDEILQQIKRLIFPLGLTLDILDAAAGEGQYKDRSGIEILQRFFELHTPIMRSVHKEGLVMLLGGATKDLKLRTAISGYWKWRFDKENNVVPSGTKRGSIKQSEIQFNLNFRRAMDAIKIGQDPTEHIIKAFNADPRDISSAIRARKLLDTPDLTQPDLAKLKKRIGPKSYNMLVTYDLTLELLARQYKALSKVGSKVKSTTKKIENLTVESSDR